jgi:hypothetical protein
LFAWILYFSGDSEAVASAPRSGLPAGNKNGLRDIHDWRGVSFQLTFWLFFLASHEVESPRTVFLLFQRSMTDRRKPAFLIGTER